MRQQELRKTFTPDQLDIMREYIAFRYSKPPKTRTRVSYPVMIDYAIYECKS
jgi:hypothetical protein